MNLKRYAGESRLKFIIRRCDAKTKDESWEAVADNLREELDEDYTSSAYRKAYQYWNMVSDELKDITLDEQREEIELLKDELYKERCKLQDVVREKRRDLREEARYENLIELVKDGLDDYLPDFKVNDYKPIENNQEQKYAVLQFSDWHAGAVIDNAWNFYDIETMVDRAEIIRDKAVKYCRVHNVNNLVIEINGDMVNGLIHISSRVESEEGVIQQIITVTDVLARIINSLKPFFNSIKVVTTLGNHGRLTASKADSITKENFEMLIPVMLRDKLEDVQIIDSKGLDFVQYTVDNKVIMLAHGQNDSLNKAIGDFSKMYKTVPNEVHLGHFHSYKDSNDCGINVTVNGSLMGADDYAISIRKVSTPSQNLIVYEGDDRCIYELKAN